MNVTTNTKAVSTQQPRQAPEVQPQSKPPVRTNEAAPKQASQPVADVVTISTQGVDAQRKSEPVRTEARQAPPPKSLVDRII